MAHWWELWSPGLQAVGGIVEFLGILVLTMEWWRAGQETIKKLDLRDKRRKRTEKWDTDSETDTSEYLSEVHYLNARRSDEQQRADILLRQKLYMRGFALICIGVLMQVCANAIAWAGAYGLLS